MLIHTKMLLILSMQYTSETNSQKAIVRGFPTDNGHYVIFELLIVALFEKAVATSTLVP